MNVEAISMTFLYSSICLLAICGNGMVCYIVLSNRRMRTVTNFFIVNLAIGDILMASLCIPFTFVSNNLLGYWPFGALMCNIVAFSQGVSVFVSAYTLVAISIDRYIAVIYPLRPKMTKLQAEQIIFCIWLVGLLTPLPTALMSKLSHITAENVTRTLCNEQWADMEQYRYAYSIMLTILQYFFPLIVLVVTYTRIAMVVWGKTTPGEAEDARDRRLAASKRKMIKMMITCVTAFTLCWLPFNILSLLLEHFPELLTTDYIGYVYFLCHWLAMSHACYNPIIYCWMNSRYREGFKYLLRWLPCFSARIPDYMVPTNSSATKGIVSRSYKGSRFKNGKICKDVDRAEEVTTMELIPLDGNTNKDSPEH
ncbi:RYamide receptor-like [Brevipalpus obovatus]|uniref:RYamide receptor-like n=1 Tax=Brevipalpus obovatus TaxID=246614 RepID=UPI003D9F434D